MFLRNTGALPLRFQLEIFDPLRMFRNVFLQRFAIANIAAHAFFCFVLVGSCSPSTAGQQQDGSAALDTDNTSAFVHQYSSMNSVADMIAAYKKINRPGPVFIPHPLRTHPNPSMPGRNAPYPAQFLIDLSESASLVVVAHAGISKTLLMDDGSFLYSNFLFTVDQVLLDRENKVVNDDNIYVTRIEGTLTLQGMVVNAIDPEFQAFEPGGKYLLFLQHIPGTNFFHATAPGSFALGGRQFNKADGEAKRMDSHPLEELSTDSRTNTALTQEVINAITAAIRSGAMSNLFRRLATALIQIALFSTFAAGLVLPSRRVQRRPPLINSGRKARR